MSVLVWLVCGYFFSCTMLCWCCCKVAGHADERARQMRGRQRLIGRRILKRNHHWFVRSEASKLKMHLLRHAYRKNGQLADGIEERHHDLLCHHVPELPKFRPEESKPFRV